MPSFIWGRDIEEAYAEPYEYEAQDQFSREARKVLAFLKEHYSQKNRTFSRNDRSAEKAVWMLQVDGLSALIDALDMVDEKKHRIASRLFRDSVESLDLSFYFSVGGKKAKNDIEKWYQNEVIKHKKLRKFIENEGDRELSSNLNELYRDLSKYTHRTYRAILKSYILDGDECLVYYDFIGFGDSAVPSIISAWYARLGKLIKRFVYVAEKTNQISTDEISEMWDKSLESKSVLRHFGDGPGQMMRVSSNEFGKDIGKIEKVKS